MTLPIDAFRTKLHELHDLEMIQSLLHWDMEVMMPGKGVTARGEQLTTLSALAHQLHTSEEFGRLLSEAEQQSGLSKEEQLLLAEARYDFDRSRKLPESYVRELSDARTASYHAWTKAKRENDFSQFEPFLTRNVELARQGAELLGYADHPYDALLESYERGMTTRQIDALFTPLAAELKQLLTEILSRPLPDSSWIKGEWNTEAQKQFTERVLAELGYDFEAGRLDFAPHPFCTHFDIDDVRITTRNEDTVFGLFLSSLHEMGHALYEQGLDKTWRRTPLSQAPSLGIHECNSRLWENMVGRSLPFWERYTPILKNLYNDARLADKRPEDFAAAASFVAPSLIRVDADEVTYNLHIVIRYELEKALIEGTLAVKELPQAWNAKYQEYLGVAVPSDAQGCMQDIHWSEGIFGYFPTYTLGNLYAAQVMEKIRSEQPDLDSQIRHGNTRTILEWLRKHIHKRGRKAQAPVIIAEATNQELSSEAFLRYVRGKYLG
ncbi:MAG: carboxypeptidase M32 [Candidatus Sumerlaeia bacterium]|nr:carboxypeptidase M32 [Candidatus Sumerlaeia bacterium]